MSSSARDSLNLGFPYLLAACLYAVLSLQWLEYDENFTLGVKILADFKYDVNIC